MIDSQRHRSFHSRVVHTGASGRTTGVVMDTGMTAVRMPTKSGRLLTTILSSPERLVDCGAKLVLVLVWVSSGLPAVTCRGHFSATFRTRSSSPSWIQSSQEEAVARAEPLWNTVSRVRESRLRCATRSLAGAWSVKNCLVQTDTVVFLKQASTGRHTCEPWDCRLKFSGAEFVLIISVKL